MSRLAHQRWRRVQHAATVLFLLLVAGLIAWKARDVDWAEVLQAVRSYRPSTLAWALVISAAGAFTYCAFDLLSRAYIGHAVKPPRVMAIAFVSYAFNLNVGAMVGGAGFRYRLYSGAGLQPMTITRVLAASVTTNWIGFLALAGIVWGFGLLPLPPDWAAARQLLRITGWALLVPVAWYVAVSATPRRMVHVWRYRIRLPPLRIALLQVAVSMANWMLMAAVVFVFLREHAPYTAVLGALLVSAVGGVITHVPGGLGVTEVIFVTLLGHFIAPNTILAALLAYRAVYYLTPFAVALGVYAFLESRRRPTGSLDPGTPRDAGLTRR